MTQTEDYLDRTDAGTRGMVAISGTDFLHKILAVAPGVVYLFNHDTMANEYANKSLGTTLGYSSAEVQGMGGSLMPTICHPDDLPRVFAHFDRIGGLSDGEIIGIEYRVKAKAGHWVTLLSNDTVFDRRPDGSVRRHIGTATDVSSQREAERQVAAERVKLRATNEELRAFAYSISHDLKSPTNTLRLLLSELDHSQSSLINAEGRDLLDLCANTVTTLRQIIDDSLDYTRVIGDRPAMGPVDLRALLHCIRDDLTADFHGADAELIIGELPVVTANKPQMRSLFSNLLTNAVKFRRDGVRPMVEVGLAPPCPGASESHHVVEVSDNGIGIAPEDQASIFNLFTRLHLPDRYPGTGLGLAVCSRVMRNHGGSISVRSAANEGSTFTIRMAKQ